MWAGEQAVDEFLVGVGRLVVDKGVHFLGRRRQTNEVERYPTDERFAVGFFRWREPSFFKAGCHKPVNVVASPILVLGRGWLWLGRGVVGPVTLVLRAFIDPTLEYRHLFFGYGHLRTGRRHHEVGFVSDKSLDEFGRLGIAWHDGYFAAGFGRSDRAFADIQAEASRIFGDLGIGAVAGEAFFGKNRADVAVE